MKKILPISSEELVNNNIGLVYKVVNKIKVSRFDRDDLIQAGLMGLFEATKRYDQAKGYAFSTYAMPFIVGNIKKELRQDRIIKISSYFQPLIDYIKKESTFLSYQELASKYDTSIENVAIACGHVSGIISLDRLEDEKIKEGMINNLSFKANKIDLSVLTNLEQKIIKLRFYENLSQMEIGKMFNWSQSTVSRKIKSIIHKLKGYM